MTAAAAQLQHSAIRRHTRRLRLPAMGGPFLKLAERAAKQKRGRAAALEALPGVEVEERERNAAGGGSRKPSFRK